MDGRASGKENSGTDGLEEVKLFAGVDGPFGVKKATATTANSTGIKTLKK